MPAHKRLLTHRKLSPCYLHIQNCLTEKVKSPFRFSTPENPKTTRQPTLIIICNKFFRPYTIFSAVIIREYNILILLKKRFWKYAWKFRKSHRTAHNFDVNVTDKNRKTKITTTRISYGNKIIFFGSIVRINKIFISNIHHSYLSHQVKEICVQWFRFQITPFDWIFF